MWFAKAQGLLILALLAAAGAAHAGTNEWTAFGSGTCGTDGVPDIPAAVACFTAHVDTAQPDDTMCSASHFVTNYSDVSPPEFIYTVSFKVFRTAPGFDPCSIEHGTEWTFTRSGACPTDHEFAQGQIGACVPLKKTPPPCLNGGIVKANPCDVLSGNKVQREVDYAPASGVMSFVRTYNSSSYHPAKLGDFASPLGKGWFGSYLQYLSAPSGLSSAAVYAVRPSGGVIGFTATLPGSTATDYEAEGELNERLVVALNGSGTFVGWRLFTAADDQELYDTNGRLVSIKSRGGVTQTLSYGSNSRVASVANDFGHELGFEWDTATPPRLSSVTLPGTGSGQIEFTYGTNNNLTLVTYPDTRTREYLYELTGNGQLNLLTGIEDESSVRYSTWDYNESWLVTSSEHAG